MPPHLPNESREKAEELLVWYFNQTLKLAAQGRTEFSADGQGEIRAIVTYLIAAAVDEVQQGSAEVAVKNTHPSGEASQSTPGDIVQEAQMRLGKLQMQYRDTDERFWALAVAWEATRFAWYAVTGDRGTARDKLQRAEKAILDFKQRALRDRETS